MSRVSAWNKRSDDFTESLCTKDKDDDTESNSSFDNLEEEQNELLDSSHNGLGENILAIMARNSQRIPVEVVRLSTCIDSEYEMKKSYVDVNDSRLSD